MCFSLFSSDRFVYMNRLLRKFKNESITITFDCQDESEGNMDESDLDLEDLDASDKETEDDDDLEDDGISYGINFLVSIRKGESELLFNCVADGNLDILNCRVTNDKNVPDSQSYNGPPFENLSDSLQDAMRNFLEDRKIDADMCHFILKYSQFKEQKEYIHWLTTLAKFTD